ncbi:glutamine--fructose-6-phosphate aminotransferase [Pyrodictium occultum]|uniref:Glutamine--fructose-6-phosphate aminotransferase [isomerizing] n=1 Tax=Pyrodictium occultum TaxID=2309 RepID=A0A0V8RV09_PYROC|nr:glutamine--fructose-6-phosphate transaminase (isomerizing) [Pyrodictium occultum]KSW11892.1 glutamine--fructose-6-phosphate aminotransferase [Pyrodictium occultum]
MCGIVGVVADPEVINNVTSMLIQGLKRLEYRGYDSAGFALVECSTGKLLVFKDRGRIDDVVKAYGISRYCSISGIAHTRWATHGEPSQANAHPHVDCRDEIAVVHNGIIRNFLELRRLLEEKGHRLRSETDTEVIAHLLEEYLKTSESMWDAFRKLVKVIDGAYAIAVLYAREPHRIYFARRVSPLIIGLGEGFNMVSSDIPSMLQYTRRFVALNDGEYGYIEPYHLYIEKNGSHVEWRHRIITATWSIEDAEKGGYPHYMLKEIMEQPRVLFETYTGLVSSREVEEAAKLIAEAGSVFVTGAGTSFHAGLVFAYYMSRIAGKPVIPFISSEYAVFKNIDHTGSVLIAISQSGETIDTLQALRGFRASGGRVVAVSNVVGSTIPRESDIAVYTRAGPEIGVAATKTFLTQVLTLSMIALATALYSGSLTKSEYREATERLKDAGRAASTGINRSIRQVELLASSLRNKTNIYVLGRGLGVPLSYEAALKIKEVSYLHAEAYPAGESKHGPIALVEKDFPVVFVATPPEAELLEKIQSNVMEMKSRGASTILVGTSSYLELEGVDFAIDVGSFDEILAPYALVPPLQLLAYRLAVVLGRDPDKPRNLAKTVTVE